MIKNVNLVKRNYKLVNTKFTEEEELFMSEEEIRHEYKEYFKDESEAVDVT